MFLNFIKFFIIILLYQTNSYSKSNSFINFNNNSFSNYFSGIVAYENKNNSDALNFFRSSKFLIKKHRPYLKRFINSLVLENRIKKAINEVQQNKYNDNTDFFEAYLLLTIDSIKKNNFKDASDYILKASKFNYQGTFNSLIADMLKEYIYVFDNKKIIKNKKNVGDFSLITEIFQRCYLSDEKTDFYFLKLLNISKDVDYSRYLFFYLNYLVEQKRFGEIQNLVNDVDFVSSTLLLSQGKEWIKKNKINEFGKYFSCSNANDVTSEFLFLISNLYSSQGDYKKSNFYINLSYFLNPKFKFNLSLLAENHFFNNNYNEVKKVLNIFDKNQEFYYWFKIKKEAQIISEKLNSDKALNYLNKKFNDIENPNIKMIYDMANFNKNSERYKIAIKYYDQMIDNFENKSKLKAKILYKRGGSYERLKNYDKADKDLLKSIKLNPDDAYALNYLAYSWLERDHKINRAFQMLEKAHSLKQNDPYIIDSIGWAYYLIEDYLEAEKYLQKAVELMPDDPIVNDHYGDILWKLDRKIQATYFWKSVLELKDTDQEMKDQINIKLIEGLKKS